MLRGRAVGDVMIVPEGAGPTMPKQTHPDHRDDHDQTPAATKPATTKRPGRRTNRTNRRYTREFKLSAVRLVNEQGYSCSEAARSLGVDPANIRDWVERFGIVAGLEPSGSGAMRAELQRLRKENALLRTEQEILKKAAAFFAREQRP